MIDFGQRGDRAGGAVRLPARRCAGRAALLPLPPDPVRAGCRLQPRRGVAQRYNGDLANDLGNALNRSLHLTAQNFGRRRRASAGHGGDRCAGLAGETTRGVEAAMRGAGPPGRAARRLAVHRRHQQVPGRPRPWVLAKAARPPGKRSWRRCSMRALEGCRPDLRLAHPIHAVRRRRDAPPARSRSNRPCGRSGDRLGRTPAGATLRPRQPIFPRIDRRSSPAELERPAGASQDAASRSRAAKGRPHPMAETPSAGPAAGSQQPADPQPSPTTTSRRLELRVVEIL